MTTHQVERILAHTIGGLGGHRFCVLWSDDDTTTTWEPVTSFVTYSKRRNEIAVNVVWEKYCERNGLAHLVPLCIFNKQRPSRKMHAVEQTHLDAMLSMHA